MITLALGSVLFGVSSGFMFTAAMARERIGPFNGLSPELIGQFLSYFIRLSLLIAFAGGIAFFIALFA